MLIMNTTMRSGCSVVDSRPLFSLKGWKSTGLFSKRNNSHANPCSGFLLQVRAFALRKNEKKVRNIGSTSRTKTSPSKKLPSKEYEDTSGNLPVNDGVGGNNSGSFSVNLGESSQLTIAPRSSVLQACVFTSGGLLAFGALIRQLTHFVSMEGWPILDASAEVPFGFEMWHIELIMGLVVLISSCRYMLLKVWPDFAESSEAANQQVLSSLQPLDFVAVAFLPGISEELLFRGALLPAFGLTWISALIVGAIFGALHLGSGRRYSFAIWATFVGFAYGLATVVSSSVLVPMASHSLNNLIGGILWKYTSNTLEEK